jgi:MFS superfamily sulfate permease-like transporter
VALAGMLSILSGLLFVLAGMARFGFVTDLLSTPIRYGYLNGIALTVLAGQLPKVFGFSVSGANLIEETVSLVRGILAQQTNWFALAIGAACLILILGLKRYLPAVPGVLVAVVAATVAVALFDLGARSGLSVVGPLPQGLPAFRLPAVSLQDIGAMFAGAAAVALVSFADMSVLSRAFAVRGGYDVDGNQELIALGAANVAAGLFRGFPITSSASRTPVAEAAGGKTQITGVVGAVCIEQRVAHSGGRSRGREDPDHRRRRCRVHRLAARLGAGVAEEFAQCRPRRRCDLRLPLHG